ncbi:universal stress protein [Hydrogenothermus marinus]|uniref:Universal stress protein n=1 Tax=Hydrogenothermus marinus TaxID=133270 RepID=A0A3M0BAE1_9AQUI|nr:universal stress protein [Hydrogenothermus marinus]RMA93129.1 nucleotide-binding universal stress UspA family protein [Hydrogenothermus marinus]
MGFKKIVLGYDGSEPSKKALEKAVELTKEFEAELFIVAVVKPFEFAAIDYIPTEEIEKYEKEEISKEKTFLNEAEEYARSKGVGPFTKVLEGEPAEELMDFADENGCDLIVVGYRGKGGFKKLLLGSTAGNLVKYANQSVLIVK